VLADASSETRPLLLQVIEAWLGEPTKDGLREGVWELQNELQNELADGELEDG